MYELITDKTLAEYEAFVQSHPKGNFAQSSLWAKQKPPPFLQAVLEKDLLPYELPLSDFSDATALSYSHL